MSDKQQKSAFPTEGLVGMTPESFAANLSSKYDAIKQVAEAAVRAEIQRLSVANGANLKIKDVQTTSANYNDDTGVLSLDVDLLYELKLEFECNVG